MEHDAPMGHDGLARHDAIVDGAIRKVPDFPKPGILFYDLTSLLATPDAFAYTVDRMEEIYRDEPLDAVAAIEARGFLLAAPFALRKHLPLVLLRKKGKLPRTVRSREFQLEYGTDRIEVHQDDVPRGGRVLVVDDLIATGGTVEAACELIEEVGASVAGVFA
ncbi:MAG: adenine phosphoribosyltransferase, partial [Alkalispirochaeta sp.]